MAHQALEIEDRGRHNAAVHRRRAGPPDGTVEIAEINPVASLQAINKSALAAKATEVAAKLRSALDRI